MTTDNEKRLAALLHEERIGCTPSRGSDYDLRCHNDAAARLTARGVTVGLDVEAAHIVEQQGLALGRLRAAARAALPLIVNEHQSVVSEWSGNFGGHVAIRDGWVEYDEDTAVESCESCAAIDALRAALEEADRG